MVSAGASVAVELSSEPQAASPKDIVSASAASPVLATRVRVRLVFMVCLSVGGAVLVRRVARSVLVVRYDRAVGLGRAAPDQTGFQATLTTIDWTPLAPSGKTVARADDCGSPFSSRARTASMCWPGSASQSTYHWRQ